MARQAVTIEGLTEAKAALLAMPEEFRRVAAASIEVGTAIMEGEADMRVPEDEGDLRASLGRAVRADGLQATVYSTDPKARWVEFATVDTPAQPFLWPAFQIGARYIRKAMRTSWVKEVGQRLRLKSKRRMRAMWAGGGWSNG